MADASVEQRSRSSPRISTKSEFEQRLFGFRLAGYCRTEQ